jgi:hypothetical protein
MSHRIDRRAMLFGSLALSACTLSEEPENSEGGETSQDVASGAIIEAVPQKGPNYGPCGSYEEIVGWRTNMTTGYIVQQIARQRQVHYCDGSPAPDLQKYALYWEVWPVAAGDLIDGYIQASFPATQGQWEIEGQVFWVPQIDPKAGFVAGKVRDAGSLLSTTTPPKGLGTPRLFRKSSGAWICCAGRKEHARALSTQEDHAYVDVQVVLSVLQQWGMNLLEALAVLASIVWALLTLGGSVRMAALRDRGLSPSLSAKLVSLVRSA